MSGDVVRAVQARIGDGPPPIPRRVPRSLAHARARAGALSRRRARRALAFPRDHGSHPAFRTEWWYVTGWLRDAREREFGVQVTFFRTRPGVAEESASRFAPTQLLFAHAAIADPALGRLRHDERAARAGFGLAQATQTHDRRGDRRLVAAP